VISCGVGLLGRVGRYCAAMIVRRSLASMSASDGVVLVRYQGARRGGGPAWPPAARTSRPSRRPAPRAPAAAPAWPAAPARRWRPRARHRTRPAANRASQRRLSLHHMSDLLTPAAAAQYSRFLPAQEVILSFWVPHRTEPKPPTRWFEAQAAPRRPSHARPHTSPSARSRSTPARFHAPHRTPAHSRDTP